MSYDTWKLDSPPEDGPAPAPVPLWHFYTEDYEHEHWTESEREADTLMAEYTERGEPFTVTQELVEPDEAPPPEDDSDAFVDY